MRKWIVLIITFMLLLFWQGFDTVWSISHDRQANIQDLLDYVDNETNYEVLSTERYHGEQLFYILTAQDETNQEMYLFFGDEDRDMRKIVMDDIQLSKDKVVSTALTSYQELNEIVRVTPAFTGNRFAWEVVAKDDRGIQYLYYNMKSGEFIKRYRLS